MAILAWLGAWLDLELGQARSSAKLVLGLDLGVVVAMVERRAQSQSNLDLTLHPIQT